MESDCNKSSTNINSYNNNSNHNAFMMMIRGNGKEFDVVLGIWCRFVRGFSTGICLRAGYILIRSLLRKSLKTALIEAWRTVLSKSSVQTATFLGLFPSLYRLALIALKKIRGIEDDWNYRLSGAIAGLSLLCLDQGNRQTIAFFSLSRALGAGIPTLVARGDLPNIPHVDTFVFSLCTGVIMYSACMRPDYLPPGYYKSILEWAHDFPDHVAIKLFRNPGPRFLTCQEVGVHESPSCIKHSLTDIKRATIATAKIFFPIHALPVLLFKRKELLTSLSSVLESFVKNMAASTSFLVTMVTVAKISVCSLRNLHHQSPPMPAFIPLISGSLGAWLGVLWERKSRRRELALFVTFQNLGILYAAIKNSPKTAQYANIIPHGFTILFSLSMLVIMHAYEKQPKSLNSIINIGLKFIVGAREVNAKNTKISN